MDYFESVTCFHILLSLVNCWRITSHIPIGRGSMRMQTCCWGEAVQGNWDLKGPPCKFIWGAVKWPGLFIWAKFLWAPEACCCQRYMEEESRKLSVWWLRMICLDLLLHWAKWGSISYLDLQSLCQRTLGWKLNNSKKAACSSLEELGTWFGAVNWSWIPCGWCCWCCL